MHQFCGSVDMGVNGMGGGWDGWWREIARESHVTQMTKFRVVVTCTSTHSGPVCSTAGPN